MNWILGKIALLLISTCVVLLVVSLPSIHGSKLVCLGLVRMEHRILDRIQSTLPYAFLFLSLFSSPSILYGAHTTIALYLIGLLFVQYKIYHISIFLFKLSLFLWALHLKL
jgi:hypothetical protein